ncbi:MAG: DUF1385 domain-containing protein [Lachnospiraceae bacterium]|nr:DUF1385 domain-containing protein [Lachnospiraceae bacterium]
MAETKFRPSGIGGQAVMEGIMMKNKQKYAVAVRKPDKEIEVDVKEYVSMSDKHKICRVPFIRGVFSFVDSLVVGMKCMLYSADFFLEETPEEKAAAEAKREKAEAKKARKKNKGATGEVAATAEEAADEKPASDINNDALMIPLVLFSVVMAVGLFMVLPLVIADLLVKFVPGVTDTWRPIIEGVVKMILFISYMLLVSLMEDIKRTFMYHGAEHKCINCIENGMELNVENVRKSSRYHKRCGTSFLLIVMIVSIVFFLFMNFENIVLRYVVRLLCVPIIAGISYEFIRLAGRSENKLVGLLSKPGMAMQKITTKEPTDDMIEVAIAAVEAVFDWKAYLNNEEL